MQIISVELLCDDLQSTADFYSRKLDLPVHFHDADTLVIDAGHSRIIFRRSVSRNPVYHLAFTIPENQLEDAVQKLKKHVEFIKSGGKVVVDFAAWNAHSVYFCDCNGNILEMIARHDLQNAATQPFSGKSILCVSEVGIVTRDVLSFCDYLRKSFGITDYEKQPSHENFAAIGDAYGLLIVSKEGRHWFPTNAVSRPFPLSLKFEVNGQIRTMNVNGDLHAGNHFNRI